MTTQDTPPSFTRCTILMDALRDGIVLVDTGGIVQLINKSARAMYQGSEVPLVGYPLSDFNAADWVEVKRVLSSGTALQGQRMTLPAAEVLVNRIPLRAQGELSGVLCSLHSLEDSNTHIQHLSSYRRLQEDMEALMAQPDMGMLLMDAQGRIRNVNALFERWSGKGRESFLGLPVASFQEHDTLGAFSALLRCLENSAPVVRYGNADDGRRVCSIATPSFAGEVLRFVLVRVLDCEETVRLCGTSETESPHGVHDTFPVLADLPIPLDESEAPVLAQARLHGMVVKSRIMAQLVQKMERVGQTESSVLLQGESGVGKSVFASFIHKLSYRGKASFVAINCGAIPESLMESELFGYERGAFTGADPKGKVGLLEAGNGGTVFLDEIGELPMPMQVKLLEAIDKKAFMRVGGTRTVKVDIRIIAATNRILEEEVRKGNFRKDLYYRLNVIPLTIPPLRERPEDIVAMTVEYLLRYNSRQGGKKRITPEVMDLLARHPFHGNVRELLNTLEWLVVMSEGHTLTPRELPMSFHSSALDTCIDKLAEECVPSVASVKPFFSFEGLTLKDAVQAAERQCIEQALARYNTLFEAAQVLGVHPTTLWRKMGQSHMAQDKTR